MLPPHVLVGIAELASMLKVTKQRADQLSRQQGFPAPVERVIPLDDQTEQAVRAVLAQRGGTANPDVVLRRMKERSVTLPPTPRLWRIERVEEWAKENGRSIGAP